MANAAIYAINTGPSVTTADVVDVLQSSSALLTKVQDAGTTYDATTCYCFTDDWKSTTKAFTSARQTVSSTTACTTACPGSAGQSGKYVVVKASHTYVPIFSASSMWLSLAIGRPGGNGIA